jgi:predicted nucleotidyltransferase
LLEIKMRQGEAATSARWTVLHDFIERELEVAQAHAFASHPKADAGELDAYLHQAVLHFEARPQDQEREFP